MFADADRVIVTAEDPPSVSVHVMSAHHRDFPEIHGEGWSAAAAAHRLGELLHMSLDNAPSHWRREALEKAIEDVEAFSERGGS